MLGATMIAGLAGLAGSPHCAAMCGPLVVGCARTGGGGFGALRAFVAQQSGRLAAYVALGLAAGAAGSAADGLTIARTSFQVLPAAIGVLLIGFGLAELVETGRLARVLAPVRGCVAAVLRRGTAVVKRAPEPLRPVLVGSLSALLPCGLLHATVLAAAATGSAAGGAALLAAFFCGTLPMLAVVALGMNLLASLAATPWLRSAALIGAGVALLAAGHAPVCCGHGD